MLLDQIDWADLEYHLETREGDDPEAILHELAHVVDALGAQQAFLGGFGNQKKVDGIIADTFSTPEELEATEMRATAITVQVLDILAPEMSHFESGYQAMLSNLPGEPTQAVLFHSKFEFEPSNITAEERRQALTQCLTSPAVQSSVKAILLFLEDFQVENEDDEGEEDECYSSTETPTR